MGGGGGGGGVEGMGMDVSRFILRGTVPFSKQRGRGYGSFSKFRHTLFFLFFIFTLLYCCQIITKDNN